MMASRQFSATYPMSATNPQGTVFQDKSDAATITVVSAPPRTITDTQPTANGFVRLTETRSTLTPTVSAPQTLHSNTWTEELQPTVTTKTYETMRRDIASMFPGSTILSVGGQSVGATNYTAATGVYGNTSAPVYGATTAAYPITTYPTTAAATYHSGSVYGGHHFARPSISTAYASTYSPTRTVSGQPTPASAYIPPPQTYGVHTRHHTLGYVPYTPPPSVSYIPYM